MIVLYGSQHTFFGLRYANVISCVRFYKFTRSSVSQRPERIKIHVRRVRFALLTCLRTGICFKALQCTCIKWLRTIIACWRTRALHTRHNTPDRHRAAQQSGSARLKHDKPRRIPRPVITCFLTRHNFARIHQHCADWICHVCAGSGRRVLKKWVFIGQPPPTPVFRPFPLKLQWKRTRNRDWVPAISQIWPSSLRSLLHTPKKAHF